MTKNIILLVILLFIAAAYHAQKLRCRDYFRNNYSFLSELNNNVLEDVHCMLIKTITEQRVELVNGGIARDTTVLFRYYFDELGNMIEKRKYYSSDIDRCFIEEYMYSSDYSRVDTTFCSTSDFMILEGSYIPPMSSEANSYDRSGRINYSMNEFYEGELEYAEFEYSFGSWDLPRGILVTSNKWIYSHEIILEYWSRHKY